LQNLQDRLAFRSSHIGSIILLGIFVAEAAGGRTALQLQSSLDHVGWRWEALFKKRSVERRKKKKKKRKNERKKETKMRCNEVQYGEGY